MEKNNEDKLVIFRAEDGKVSIDVHLDNNTVWLTQADMVKLFGRNQSVISRHINNALEEGEVSQKSNMQKMHIANSDRPVVFYDLDVVISVGYRVKSIRGVEFRRWATKVLHEYIQKGFALNDDRMKYGNDNQAYYFDELLERIQDIRTSERRFYQKITDIFATSIDYNKSSNEAHDFFATVQNKLHWAISGNTAAEIVYRRANAQKPHMGLTSWRGAQVRKADIEIAKNYLTKKEITALNGITEQYLVFAQSQASQHISMTMKNWIEKLHAILQINSKKILDDAGRVSHKLAIEHANMEYKKFATARAIAVGESDFDEFVKQIGNKDD